MPDKNTKIFIINVAIYGAFAALLNTLFLVEAYGNLTFHFGQLVVFLCLLTRGFRTAMFVAVISSASLAIATSNPYFVLTLLAELICVGWLYRKGMALFISDIIYWCLIGIPLSYGIIFYRYDFSIDYASLLLIKQLLNGLIYSLLASSLLVFFPLKWCIKSSRPKERSLNLRIFYLSMVTTVLPALLVAILFTSRTVSTYQAELAEVMNSTASRLTLLSERHLDTRQRVINHVAHMLPITQKPDELLASTQKSFPGFLTMLIADKNGVLIHGAPRGLFDKLNKDNLESFSVADREYFQVPKDTGKPFISHVFKGRGFGNDSIIAISSPLIVDGEFLGIVEGSLKLADFEVMHDTLDMAIGTFYIILTDSNNRVIHASREMPFSENQEFSITPKSNQYSNDSLLTEINGQEYFFDSQKSSFGWTVYLFTSPDSSTSFFINNMIILLLALTVLSGFFLIVVRRFSSQVTVPLKSIIEQFRARKKQLVPTESLFVTSEIRQVAEQLEESGRLMDNFNQQLEKKVVEKTNELSELNRKLEESNRRDALTGLFNRRHFDEMAASIINSNMRNSVGASIAVIDIDYFKSINDNYGHPAGDECLKKIADILKQHFTRKSDIVARYGGEEFVVILSGDHYHEHIALLERLRAKVASETTSYDMRSISFTISVGLASIKNGEQRSLSELMSEADSLLYRSKAQGRNQVSHS